MEHKGLFFLVLIMILAIIVLGIVGSVYKHLALRIFIEEFMAFKNCALADFLNDNFFHLKEHF